MLSGGEVIGRITFLFCLSPTQNLGLESTTLNFGPQPL